MFIPENDLERVLIKASTDSAALPEFYSVLAASTIYMMQPGTPILGEISSVTLDAGTKLAFYPLHQGERKLLPLFSSPLRLRDFYGQRTQFLQILEMRTIDFLSTTCGAELVLNPGSEYGKEFTVSEIERILDGWKPSKTYITEKPTQVRLGQPANYPHALTEALSRLFSTLKDVECAYLAHLDNPAQGDPPHTLIGIKAAGDWNDIASRAGMVLAGVKIPNPPVDFFWMKGEAGLEDYLLTTKPFYKRKDVQPILTVRKV